MIGFISTSVTLSLLITLNYKRFRYPTHVQFTAAHALGFSVFTSRILATYLNTETSTSNHYEISLPFLVQSPWNLGSSENSRGLPSLLFWKLL
jgi:hypothetical protein